MVQTPDRIHSLDRKLFATWKIVHIALVLNTAASWSTQWIQTMKTVFTLFAHNLRDLMQSWNLINKCQLLFRLRPLFVRLLVARRKSTQATQNKIDRTALLLVCSLLCAPLPCYRVLHRWNITNILQFTLLLLQ